MKEVESALKITKACIYTRGVHVMLFKSLLPSLIFPYFIILLLKREKKMFFIIPQPIYTFLQYYYQVSLPISVAFLLNLYICTNVSCHFHTKSFTFLLSSFFFFILCYCKLYFHEDDYLCHV